MTGNGGTFFTFISVLCLIGCSWANSIAAVEGTNPGEGEVQIQGAVAELVGTTTRAPFQLHHGVDCSSWPKVDKPCNLTAHQGFFGWVKDTRQFEWIYMTFCLTLGSCIFIIVISAAIHNAKTYKKKQAKLLEHIRDEDEKARLAIVHEQTRRGSHLAHPRRSSLSVCIQDPDTLKHKT